MLSENQSEFGFQLYTLFFYFVKRDIEKKHMQNRVKIAEEKYKKDCNFRTLTKIAVLVKIY